LTSEAACCSSSSAGCGAGGRLEPGETPEQAVVREAQEETGVKIDIQRLVCTREWPDGFVLHVFATTISSVEPHAPPSIREVA
jgi:8-oxo-dGTP pyrophosphatase MutT (NUDIX family)